MNEYIDVDNLPFPIIGQITKDYILPAKLRLHNSSGKMIEVPKDTTVKLKQTTNFGFIFLPEEFENRIFRF